MEILNTNDNVEVVFKTKTGKVRTMNCTRNTTESGGDNSKLNGPSIIAVFDLLIKEWRAFRKDSILSYKLGS
jgi:hypothetical protein